MIMPTRYRWFHIFPGGICRWPLHSGYHRPTTMIFLKPSLIYFSARCMAWSRCVVNSWTNSKPAPVSSAEICGQSFSPYACGVRINDHQPPVLNYFFLFIYISDQTMSMNFLAKDKTNWRMQKQLPCLRFQGIFGEHDRMMMIKRTVIVIMEFPQPYRRKHQAEQEPQYSENAESAK